MAWWRRTANLFRRERMNREIRDELEAHIAMRAEENVARGLSPEQARREARVCFGNPVTIRETTSAADAMLGIAGLMRDLRFAARQLRRAPAFALTSVLVLALGMGAATAIFSAVYPILFEPLPYPHASRIAMVWDTYQGQKIEATYGTFRELVARSRSFDSMATFESWQPVHTGTQVPERFDGQAVSASYFTVLGVAPALGRGFQPADDIPHGPRVVVMSDRLWRQRFGADAAIIGRMLRLDDDTYTVIGVMPRSFEDVSDPAADVYTSAQYDPAKLSDLTSAVWGHHLHIAGRLRAGVSVDNARRELQQIAEHPETEFPRPRWASLTGGLIVDSLQQDLVRSVKPALLAVMAAVVLLLLIACVNVTSLLLARAAQRRGEFAMRTALGAEKARLIRQSITETLLLAGFGGSAGLALAAIGVRVLVSLSPPGLPRLDAIALNGPVFLFAFAVSTLVGLAAGVLPAMQAPRASLQSTLHQGGRATSGSRHWTRRVLVVWEVALALVLLVGAGLLLRSMQRLLAVDPGFDGANLLTFQVQTSGHKFDDPVTGTDPSLSSVMRPGSAARRRFFEQALAQVRKVPGVMSAGFSSLLPLSGDPYWVGVYGSHFEQDKPNIGYNVYRYAVSPGYCEAMRIPLLRGRLLDARDTVRAPFAALLSESLAKKEFPRGDALGKRLHVGPTNYPWFTVVGVVGDVRQESLALADTDAVYLPTVQSWFADDTLSFVVRTRGDAAAMVTAVRQAIWSVDKDQPVLRAVTMRMLLDRSLAQRRFVLILFEAFSLVALLLAATGIYGILANNIAERTREIGVRAALGASRADLLVLVLRQGIALAAIGIVIGLGVSVIATRALTSLLFGVSNFDPFTYACVAAVLLVIAGLACILPARRAILLDPMRALRTE